MQEVTTEEARAESEEAATTTLKPRQHVVVDDSDLETEQQRQRVIELSKTILENDQQLESEEGEGDAVQRPKKSLTSSGSSGKAQHNISFSDLHIPSKPRMFQKPFSTLELGYATSLFVFSINGPKQNARSLLTPVSDSF